MRDLDLALLDALSEIVPDEEPETVEETVAETRTAVEPEETEEPAEPVRTKGGKK